jgi:hypothetical protein
MSTAEAAAAATVVDAGNHNSRSGNGCIPVFLKVLVRHLQEKDPALCARVGSAISSVVAAREGVRPHEDDDNFGGEEARRELTKGRLRGIVPFFDAYLTRAMGQLRKFEGSDGNDDDDDDNDDNDDSAESSSRRRKQQLQQQQQRRQALAVAAATLALPVLRLGQQKKAARSADSAEPESESAWTILRRGSSDPMDLAGLLAVLSRSPRALREEDSQGRVPLH